MSHGKPPKCVGTMARVRGVIARAAASAVMLRVPRSQSTKTAFAPRFRIMFPTEKKVIAEVTTSSPAPMPHTWNATSIAAVAEVNVRTGLPP